MRRGVTGREVSSYVVVMLNRGSSPLIAPSLDDEALVRLFRMRGLRLLAVMKCVRYEISIQEHKERDLTAGRLSPMMKFNAGDSVEEHRRVLTHSVGERVIDHDSDMRHRYPLAVLDRITEPRSKANPVVWSVFIRMASDMRLLLLI